MSLVTVLALKQKMLFYIYISVHITYSLYYTLHANTASQCYLFQLIPHEEDCHLISFTTVY